MKALLVVLVLLAAPRAFAGPWTPGRWHFYLQLRESALFADDRFDARGRRVAIEIVPSAGASPIDSSYRQALSDLFVEVGMAARLSLLADFRFLSAIWQPAGAATRQVVGVSDLFLGAKLVLFDDELTASLLCGVVAPIGSTNQAIPLGTGDLRGDFMLQIGKLFEHPSLFISAELGVRVRGSAEVADPLRPGAFVENQYSHELRYAADLGYSWQAHRRALEALIISIKLEGSYAFDAPIEDGLGLLDARAGSYVKLGPELIWAMPRGVRLSLGGNTFIAGKSLPAMTEIALGLGYAR